ncbi:MAG: ABC transporter permease [Eubacteriales bacterium]|nr:ABC transporter permease [Eubacteriales bacterium]
MDLVLSFLTSVIRQTVPILYVALGVLVIQTSGILEMASEGKMLLSCFITAIVAFYTGSAWIGLIVGTLATGIIGVIYIWLIQEFHLNQIIVGLSFNTLALGITSLLFRQKYAAVMEMNPILPTFEFRPAGFSIPVYVAFLMVPLLSLFLKRTTPGLKIRSVGENPRAVESIGLSVKRVRYMSGFLGSLLIGIGGAFFVLGVSGIFAENMTSGRGYIAMTAVSFGKFTPIGTLASVVLFGTGDALQYRLQAAGNIIPHQFAQMVPYLMTVIALVVFAKNPNSPSSLGKPYYKSR